MNAVDSKVEGGKAAGQEAPPPPVVVLRTEMKVAEQDRGLRTGDDENHEHEEQESIHVIDLTGPDTVEDEEELNENAAEGEDTAHDDAGDGLSVDGLVRDLSRNLIGPHWLLYGRLPESKVGSDKGQGDGDTEPESQERHQGEEGDSGGGSLIPQHQVQDEKVSEDDAGTQHRREKHIALPLFSTK